MFGSKCNKGISLIEVLIALFLISVGILALLSLQPSAWRTSGRSDLLGRAAGILHQELETWRILILNEGNPNPCAQTNPRVEPRTVYPSGWDKTTGTSGDIPFYLRTTITDLNFGEPLEHRKSWRVTVQITWPGNPTGITETIVVGRQLSFAWPPL